MEAGDVVAPPLAGAAVAGLDFVGDDEAAGFVDHGGGALHEAGGDVGEAFVGEDGAEDEAGDALAGALEGVDAGCEAGEVGVGEVGFGGALEEGAVGFGEGDGADFGGAVLIEGEAGEFGDEFGIAVVGAVGADDALVAGGEAGHADGDFDGFGAGAGDDDGFDFGGFMEAGEAFAEGDDVIVEVAAVDVEGGLGAGHGGGDGWVGVTDAGDVVVHVGVAAAGGVKQVDAFAADEVERVGVEEGGAGAEGGVAAGDEGLVGHGGFLRGGWADHGAGGRGCEGVWWGR